MFIKVQIDANLSKVDLKNVSAICVPNLIEVLDWEKIASFIKENNLKVMNSADTLGYI